MNLKNTFLAAVVLCASPLALAQTTVKILTTTTQDADGRFNTDCPAGNCVPGGGNDFAWTGAIPDFSPLTVGVSPAIDHDLTQYCTGTDCGSVTYALETVTGSACETGMNGWSINTTSGADLENSIGGAAGGDCRVTLTFGGETIQNAAAVFTWNFISDPTDGLAPPYISGVDSPANGTNQVTLLWPSVCDNHDGTSAASGTKQYNIRLDGSPVETIAATQCSTGLPTQIIVGTDTGGSCTPSGNNADIASNSDGLGGTTDDYTGCSLSVTGDFDVSVRINSVTNGGMFQNGGLMARADNADQSSAFAGVRWNSNLVQDRSRLAQGSGVGSICASESQTLPAYIRMKRTGDSFEFWEKDATSGHWGTPFCSYNVSLPATVQVQQFYTGANTQGTMHFQNFNLSTVGVVSRDVSTMSGGTWTVSVDDNDDNESAFSVGISASPAEGGEPPSGAQPFLTEDFEGYPLGYFLNSDPNYGGQGVWWTNDRCNNDTSPTIVNTAPDGIPGASNYMRGKSVRSFLTMIENCGTHRAELALTWAPYAALSLTRVAGGHLYRADPIWYGSSVCVSEIDYISGSPVQNVYGHVHQWHHPLAIVGTQPPGGINVDQPGFSHSSYHDSPQSSGIIGPTPATFTCRTIITRKVFDSRTVAEGGLGETTIWMDSCAAPVFDADHATWIEESLITQRPTDFLMFKLGYYKPGYNWAGVPGAYSEIQHDNIAIFTDTMTTCADVLATVNSL